MRYAFLFLALFALAACDVARGAADTGAGVASGAASAGAGVVDTVLP